MNALHHRWPLLTALTAFLLLPRASAARPSGTVAGHVLLKQKGVFGAKPKSDRSGVVIYLENVPGPPPKGALAPQMRQQDKSFKPHVVAVMKGASVEFPNDDKIFHNVFSLSQVAKFDLGLYKSGTSKTVTFDRVGSIDVYCNIHPEMAATIKVLDTGFFAISDHDGAFHIDDVPPGTYPVVGWVPRGDEFHGSVTVKEGGTARVDFEITESAGSPRHLRKDGTPYGRYE